MFFDGFNYPPRAELPEPPRVPPPSRRETVLLRLVLALMFLLLLTPISAGSMIDIVHYLRGP